MPSIRGSVEVRWAWPVSADLVAALLDDADRARLARLRQVEDRNRFATARAVLRLTLGARYGMPAENIRLQARCATCGGPHGAVLPVGLEPDLRLSLAHSGNRVVVAITELAAVGVDVESIEAAAFADVDGVALAPGEARPSSAAQRAVIWTRKEAAVKATGLGLLIGPDAVQVSAADAPARLVRWVGTDHGRLQLTDLDVGAAYAAALAVAGRRRPKVELSCADAALESWVAREAPARTAMG